MDPIASCDGGYRNRAHYQSEVARAIALNTSEGERRLLPAKRGVPVTVPPVQRDLKARRSIGLRAQPTGGSKKRRSCDRSNANQVQKIHKKQRTVKRRGYLAFDLPYPAASAAEAARGKCRYDL